MDTFELPILKKTYELYKNFHLIRRLIPQPDRYTIWQKCENIIIELLECLLLAGQQTSSTKLPSLEKASVKLNLLKIFLRLTKDVKIIDLKKYLALEEEVAEIGKMLGGWIRSCLTK